MEHAVRTPETIIYGGAFNPPTLAHQAILQACVEYVSPQGGEVWLLPSASRVDKYIGVSIEHRIELCRALAQDVVAQDVQIRINTSELDRGVATETYDTLQELTVQYPDKEFRWVFGSDSVATMAQWHEGKWMSEHLRLLVVERPGHPLSQLGKNAVELPVVSSDLSSTELRRRMRDGEPYGDMVGEAVRKVLAE